MSAPLIKRLPQKVSYQQGIILYGIDNLYPERVIEVSLRSPITKSALEVTGEFIGGDGFTLNGGAELAPNKTVTKILREVLPDYTLFKTPVAIFDVNLLCEIVEVTPTPFHFVRLVPPAKDEQFSKYARLCNDWSASAYGRGAKEKHKTFPIWPGDKVKALESFQAWDYETYGPFPGFISYGTPIKNVYPLSFIDSVLDSAQTNGEIQIFELAGIQNGFLSSTLLKHQGKMTPDERLRITQLVQDNTGAENANSVMVWEVPEGFDGEVLEQFPANDQDKLFDLTNKTSANRIIQSMAIPPSLLGIMPENSFFSMQEIQEAYQYYNVRTRRRREELAEWFNMIGENFVSPLTFGALIEQKYLQDKAAPNIAQPAPPAPPAPAAVMIKNL